MTSLQRRSVTAGLVTGAGLLVTRLSMAHGGRQFVLAGGATILEIAGVLFLESKAKKLDPEIEEWRAQQNARSLAEARMSAAKEEFDRRAALVAETEAEISGIEAGIQSRTRNAGPEKVTGDAVAQARAGYTEGIAENRAGGIVPREDK